MDTSNELRKLCGIVAIFLGLQNIWLVWLHNNRFGMHVSIAKQARWRMTMLALDEDWNDGKKNPSLDPCNIDPEPGKEKKGNLGLAWMSVPIVPILAGLYLLVVAA